MVKVMRQEMHVPKLARLDATGVLHRFGGIIILGIEHPM